MAGKMKENDTEASCRYLSSQSNGMFGRLFISCERYTELTSARLDGQKLLGSQLIGYWFHHVLCMVCRRYRKQLLTIEKAAARLGFVTEKNADDLHENCSHDHAHQESDVVLSAAANESISKALESEMSSK